MAGNLGCRKHVVWLVFVVSRRAGESKVAGARRVCGWPESRNAGCARSLSEGCAVGSAVRIHPGIGSATFVGEWNRASGSDLSIGERDQSVVGDGHTVGVAAQIVHHIFRATEGTFQIDHPILSIEWPQPSGEGLGLRQKLQVSVEVELAILKGLLESVDELAAKNFLQHFLGKEVVVPGTNPAGVVEREATGRNDTMDMRMSGEFLAPSVQYAEEANVCAEVSGIVSDFEKGFGTGAEQKMVEDFLVLPDQGCQPVG